MKLFKNIYQSIFGLTPKQVDEQAKDGEWFCAIVNILNRNKCIEVFGDKNIRKVYLKKTKDSMIFNSITSAISTGEYFKIYKDYDEYFYGFCITCENFSESFNFKRWYRV